MSAKIIVIIGFWPGKALLQKPGKLTGCGEVSDLFQGIILRDVNSRRNCGIVVSGVPPPEGGGGGEGRNPKNN